MNKADTETINNNTCLAPAILLSSNNGESNAEMMASLARLSPEAIEELLRHCKNSTTTDLSVFDPEKTNEIINNIQVDLTEKQPLKVLVVEDNKINQVITKKMLIKKTKLIWFKIIITTTLIITII